MVVQNRVEGGDFEWDELYFDILIETTPDRGRVLIFQSLVGTIVFVEVAVSHILVHQQNQPLSFQVSHECQGLRHGGHILIDLPIHQQIGHARQWGHLSAGFQGQGRPIPVADHILIGGNEPMLRAGVKLN